MQRFHALKRALVPLLAHLAMAATVVVACWVGSRNPFVTEPLLDVPMVVGHVLSVVLGLGLAAATVPLTRLAGRRLRAMRLLHAELRPAVRHASETTVTLWGLASALSEELLFRGFLLPLLGLVLSSLAFGVVHQTRGAARWWWIAWATALGLLLGALFRATGSLLGPFVAHATINVLNLRWVRDTDLEPKARRLGGLLRAR